MHLIFLSTDRQLFAAASKVRERITRFGEFFPEDTFDTIVFSTRKLYAKKQDELARNTHAYPTNSYTRLLYGFDALRIARKLAHADAISAQDPFETGLAAWMISRVLRIPLVVEVHTDFLTPSFARHSLLNRIRVAIAGLVLRRAARGYAVSKDVRDAMVERYGLARNFEVLPIYVDVSRFEALPRTPERGSLLWIGRFTSEKHPGRAIRALTRARKAGHGVRLTVLGDGPQKESLVALAEELGITAYVSFPGWQDPADYLPRAELVLATSSYEGYGMAIVEALAAGVPVLSTDVGIAREAGAVIAKGDYANALQSWLSGSRARGALKLALYQGWEDYARKVHSFYASVAERNRAKVRQ